MERTSEIAGTKKEGREKKKKEDVEKIGRRQILFVLSTYFGKVRGLL